MSNMLAAHHCTHLAPVPSWRGVVVTCEPQAGSPCRAVSVTAVPLRRQSKRYQWMPPPCTLSAQAEEAVKAAGFARAAIFRPGLLNRGDTARYWEKVGATAAAATAAVRPWLQHTPTVFRLQV